MKSKLGTDRKHMSTIYVVFTDDGDVNERRLRFTLVSWLVYLFGKITSDRIGGPGEHPAPTTAHLQGTFQPLQLPVEFAMETAASCDHCLPGPDWQHLFTSLRASDF